MALMILEMSITSEYRKVFRSSPCFQDFNPKQRSQDGPKHQGDQGNPSDNETAQKLLHQGAECQASDLGLLIENTLVEQLGLARKVTIVKDSTTIISASKGKMAQNNKELTDSEKLALKIDKLSIGVPVVNAGSATEPELEDCKLCIEDAKNAISAPTKQGMVPGGSAALVHPSTCVPAIRDECEDAEELLGAEIIQKVKEQRMEDFRVVKDELSYTLKTAQVVVQNLKEPSGQILYNHLRNILYDVLNLEMTFIQEGVTKDIEELQEEKAEDDEQNLEITLKTVLHRFLKVQSIKIVNDDPAQDLKYCLHEEQMAVDDLEFHLSIIKKPWRTSKYFNDEVKRKERETWLHKMLTKRNRNIKALKEQLSSAHKDTFLKQMQDTQYRQTLECLQKEINLELLRLKGEAGVILKYLNLRSHGKW